jgi:hypothetical protein
MKRQRFTPIQVNYAFMLMLTFWIGDGKKNDSELNGTNLSQNLIYCKINFFVDLILRFECRLKSATFYMHLLPIFVL